MNRQKFAKIKSAAMKQFGGERSAGDTTPTSKPKSGASTSQTGSAKAKSSNGGSKTTTPKRKTVVSDDDEEEDDDDDFTNTPSKKAKLLHGIKSEPGIDFNMNEYVPVIGYDALGLTFVGSLPMTMSSDDGSLCYAGKQIKTRRKVLLHLSRV